MGNKRKPTKLKLIQGTARKDRINNDEPYVEPGWPKLPVAWNKRTKECTARRRLWKQICTELDSAGILTPLEGHNIETLVDLDCWYKEQRDNHTMPAAAYLVQMRGLRASLGLDSSERCKLKGVNKPGGNNPFDQYK